MNGFGLNPLPQSPVDVKEKFVRLLSGLTIKMYGPSHFWEDMYEVYSDDLDLPLLKEKVVNLLSLLDSKTKEEKEVLGQMDVEDQIWDMI